MHRVSVPFAQPCNTVVGNIRTIVAVPFVWFGVPFHAVRHSVGTVIVQRRDDPRGLVVE